MSTQVGVTKRRAAERESEMVLRLLKVMLATTSLAWLCAGQAREALRVDGQPDLYQRVLTLPGAALHTKSGASYTPAGGARVAVFTPYYVYDRQRDASGEWLEVGRKPEDGAEGWFKADTVEGWQNQLVMQYMPRGTRERVMFYENGDKLQERVRSIDVLAASKADLEQIESGASAPAGLIAVEPWEAVDQASSAYLMPIFAHRRDRFSSRGAGGTPTTLVQVAGLNLQQGEAPDNNKLEPPPAPAPSDESLDDFKVGIVFLMDTTISMGPYIERTYATVKTIYEALERSNDLDKVSFGLVAYRDHMGNDSRLEYVTKIFQPLAVGTPPEQTLRNLELVKPATASNEDWFEDTYAGLKVAVEDLDWAPFHARFIVLVTDAGPRPSGDPLSAVTPAQLEALRAEIEREHIAVTTLHLLTPGGAQDHTSAAGAYQADLGGTGDANQKKYLPIRQGSVEEFTRQITGLASSLQTAVRSASGGQVVDRPAPPPQQNAAPNMEEIVLNEIFRAQLEFLGRERGTAAPRFYRAWAADRDLTNPANESLDVSVLLTKDQLNTLAARVGEILPSLKSMALDADQGWAQLVSVAGRFSTDPGRADFVDVGSSGVLPAYLSALPYQSEILGISLDTWRNQGASGQSALLRSVENKLLIYEDLAQDDRIWLDLGAGDPNLAVFPMPLRELP